MLQRSYMKKFLFLIFISSFQVNANVACEGVPDKVYAGAHGPHPSESSYWVVLEGSSQRYWLGSFNDDLAKARFGMAQTALVASKKLSLSFYSSNSCQEAASNVARISAAYIKK